MLLVLFFKKKSSRGFFRHTPSILLHYIIIHGIIYDASSPTLDSHRSLLGPSPLTLKALKLSTATVEQRRASRVVEEEGRVGTQKTPSHSAR